MKLLPTRHTILKGALQLSAGLSTISALLYATLAIAQQPQEMNLQSDVQGQRSQPKVLFILPWEETLETQDLEIDDSLISEEDFLAPVDRVVFQRQLKMYKQLERSP